MSPYYYLYYLIYKFLILNSTSQTEERVPYVSSYLLLIGLTNYYLFLLLSINLFKYLPYSLFLFAGIFVFPITLLYFFNERRLIRNKRYKTIEIYFDRDNKFKKNHFMLFAVIFLLGSILAMIWAGINYDNN